MSASGTLLAKFAIGRGLGRTLFLWFLGLAVLPLIVAGRFTYVSARSLLAASADRLLEYALQLKSEHIQYYLSERLSAVKTQARYRSNLELLNLIAKARQASGQPLASFVRTPAWLDLAEDAGYDLHVLQQEEGYYDIMILDREGNVVFSILQEEELGSNIFHDADTPMSRACRRALATRRPVCSDLQPHGLAATHLVSFLVQVMPDAAGNPAGFIAFGLPEEHFTRIMREGANLGETGQVYLVGGDSLLRAAGRRHSGLDVLQQRIETDLVHVWRQRHHREQDKKRDGGPESGSTQGPGEESGSGGVPPVSAVSGGPAEIYTNYQGETVRGRFQELPVLADIGLDWAVVAEINASEAFNPAQQLHSIMIATVIGAMVALLFTAGGIATYIVFPIRRLSSWARRVAAGDLSNESMEQPANEIGEVVSSFREVIASFRSVAEVCEAVAVGDLGKVVKVKSEKDVLGRSVNLMAESLRGVVRQADRIVAGDYGVEIRPRSREDVLGLALEHMTTQLRVVSEENARALQEARRLVHNLDSLPSPVFTLDMDFNITYINPAGAALAGLSPQDCLGRKCQGLFRSSLCHTSECCGEQIRMDGGRTVSGKNIIDPGERNIPVEFTSAPIRNAAGEVEGVLVHLNDITEREKAMSAMLQQEWYRNGQIRLSNIIRGVHSQEDLCRNVIAFLTEYLDAQAGAIYLAGEGQLTLAAGYAFSEEVALRSEVRFGEGLAGQVALTQQSLCLLNVPEGYFPIRSFLGSATPSALLVTPFLADGTLRGVVELASLTAFPPLYQEFLEQVAEYIAIAVSAAQSRTRLTGLLAETREQARLLQVQQEELRQANEELELQTQALKASEEELQAQQEELRVTNEELEERTRALEEQQNRIRSKNEELEIARRGLERKTLDLEAASRYKSEFLANMSHELRTPLNSMLLLSGILAENREKNLSQKQTEYAATIHAAGTDLLKLINEVLDLAKVEAGKMTINPEDLRLVDFAAAFEQSFREVAAGKGVKFSIVLAERLPETIRTDRLRVEQIVRNFLSNAFKFTEKGVVSLKLGRVEGGAAPDGLLFGGLSGPALAISVSDTGIGIPPDKQHVVFEEFRQADGTTTRKYGGTGLGLSISRRLAEVLGGAIGLVSREGEGSTFSLYLPLAEDAPQEEAPHEPVQPAAAEAAVPTPVAETGQPSSAPEETGDTRRERVLLIIENDRRFSTILRELAADRGFQVITAETGGQGLELARQRGPDAIILDMGLPDMDGMAVMERLKEERTTRHIPVHIVSGRMTRIEGMKKGAIGFLAKPATRDDLRTAFSRIENILTRKVKRVMVVEDNSSRSAGIVSQVNGNDVEITVVASPNDAFRRLLGGSFDCVILDPELAGGAAFELLARIGAEEKVWNTPVLIYREQELSPEELARVREIARNTIVKEVQSPEQLADEASLFLHRVAGEKAMAGRAELRHGGASILDGKKVLLVDDDMRNLFALTSILEEKGMRVVAAKNGREGLVKLEENPDTALVLMDIMLPEIDGYEAMREIRQREQFRNLPVIALTAKAMKGDRAKCLEAGANDYMAKPVQAEKLLSLIQVWLSR